MNAKERTIRISNGNLYFDKELYETFFSGVDVIALLPVEGGFSVMPLFNNANGGRLLKLRNAKGDRVVSAPDFFRDRGIQDMDETHCPVRWNSETVSLFVALL